MKSIHLKIKRQQSPQDKPYWEEFKVPYRPNMNVISALMSIRKNPQNAEGNETTPVIYESNCLEEVCGACSMVINGKARQACSALIDSLQQPIVLEPLDKFPIVRDLMVDRKELFEALKKVKAWIEIDGTHDMGSGPAISREIQEKRYELSRCMTCGVCAQACPNYNNNTKFIGAHAVGQANLFNLHPLGSNQKKERYEALMDTGGINECGNSQNCFRACPKGIPLLASLAQLKRQTTLHYIKSIFDK